MNIVWHGHSCFEIITTRNKNERVSIIIDPFSKEIGLRVPKLQGDILLVTHQHYDHNNIKAVNGDPFVIEEPGEYEIKDIFIQGIFSWHDPKEGKERGPNTIYTIDTPEEIKVCHLGDFGQKELKEEQLEKIGEIDILMIPVGGIYTISAKEAIKIMAQLEPKITIPMHYQLPKLKVRLNSLDQFLKTLGIKKISPLKKLSIKKADLSPEEAKIVVLSP